MALNENHIFTYNFSSQSNKDWNFRLEFAKGKYATTLSTRTTLPTMFFDNITILSDYPDELPFGKPKASVLNLKIDFTVLDGDFLVLKDWILENNVFVDGKICPNQFRILSNNGRGATDVTFDTVEFWGAQDIIPEQEYKFEFGKKQSFDLKVLSVESFILNNLTDFFSIFNGSDVSSTGKFVYQYRFDGTNTSSQAVELRLRNQFVTETLYFMYSTTIMQKIVDEMYNFQLLYLRNWVANIDYENTYINNWTFYRQLYDLTTQAGSSLTSNSEILHLVYISNTALNIYGGLTSKSSKDGFYQYNNINDLISSLCEQFISKLHFEYSVVTPNLNLKMLSPFDSLNSDSISLTGDNIIGELNLKRGYFTLNETTVSYKAYKSNQNKNTYKIYGSLKNDSYDNKSLFFTNIQVAEINDFVNAGLSYLPYIMVNSLYYYDATFNEYYLLHANCEVDLKSEGTPITIANESITGDTIDPADNKSTGNKEINRAKLIEWANKRYNKSGLSYVQSKAYSNIMNDKAMLLEFETTDYILKPRDLGQLINLDIEAVSDYPSSWFISNNHNLVSCEIDLLTGISKNKIFIRGI